MNMWVLCKPFWDPFYTCSTVSSTFFFKHLCGINRKWNHLLECSSKVPVDPTMAGVMRSAVWMLNSTSRWLFFLNLDSWYLPERKWRLLLLVWPLRFLWDQWSLDSDVSSWLDRGMPSRITCLRLSSFLHGTCYLPGLRIKPMSTALAGGFLTTGPPGKFLGNSGIEASTHLNNREDPLRA